MNRASVLPTVKGLLEMLPEAFPVLIDDHSQAVAALVDDAARTGHSLVLQPLLSSKRVTQAGARVSEHVNVAVHVRINPAKVMGGFDTYVFHDAVIAALCGSPVLRAQAGSTEGDSSALIPDDLGMLTHALFFHIQITNT